MHTDAVDIRLAKRILFSVSAGYFFLPFMLAGVNAILPSIGSSLHAGAQDLGMISAAYTLGMAVAQLAAGRIGDIWGRKRAFLWGMGIFLSTGLLLCIVPSITLFLLLRFVQGCGAALYNASGLALIASSAPPAMRGRYLGLNAVAVYAGVACGPPLSGLITGLLGWRWVFALCAGICLIIWLLIRFSIRHEWRICAGEPFDWSGCAIYVTAMAALTCGANILHTTPAIGWGCLIISILCLVLFWRRELHTPFPLLHVQLFLEKRAFTLSSLASFINYSSIFGTLLYFSLYLQLARGFTVQETGMLLSIQALVQVFACPLAGQLADTRGPGRISACGIALCGLGILWAAWLDQQSSIWCIAGIQAIMGLGVSFFAVPNTSIILASAGEAYLGHATSVNGAVRTGGMLLNMVIVTVTLGFFLGEATASSENLPDLMAAMRTDFIIFGVLNLLAISCALAREKKTP